MAREYLVVGSNGYHTLCREDTVLEEAVTGSIVVVAETTTMMTDEDVLNVFSSVAGHFGLVLTEPSEVITWLREEARNGETSEEF